MFGRLLRGYTIYTFLRLLPFNGILPGAKFSLRPPSLALSYWQHYCTALKQWAQAKLCGVEHRAPAIFGRATITLDIGPHSGLMIILRCSILWSTGSRLGFVRLGLVSWVPIYAIGCEECLRNDLIFMSSDVEQFIACQSGLVIMCLIDMLRERGFKSHCGQLCLSRQ